MKIQLDTKAKTIKVEEDVNLGELTKTLNKLFPKSEWKEFKLLTGTIISNWNLPIYIDQWVYPNQPYYQQPIVWGGTTNECNGGTITANLTSNITDPKFSVKYPDGSYNDNILEDGHEIMCNSAVFTSQNNKEQHVFCIEA